MVVASEINAILDICVKGVKAARTALTYIRGLRDAPATVKDTALELESNILVCSRLQDLIQNHETSSWTTTELTTLKDHLEKLDDLANTAKDHITTLLQNQAQVASSSAIGSIKPRQAIQHTTKAIVHLQGSLKSWGDTSGKLLSLLEATARLTDTSPKVIEGIGWEVVHQLERLTHILSAASARPDESSGRADLPQYELPLQRLRDYDDALLVKEGELYALRATFTMDDGSQVVADAYPYDLDDSKRKPALLTERKNQLLRSCSLVSQLSQASPHIITCVGLAHSETYPAYLFISRPPTSSKPLSHIINNCTSTTFQRYQLAFRVADALRTVHQADFVHKNVTSANVFTTTDFSALVLGGFGTARHYSAQSFYLESTPWQARVFIAPEYFEPGRDRWVKRNDMYGLGVTLLEIGLWKRVETLMEEEEEDPSGLDPEYVRQMLVAFSDRLNESLGGHEMLKKRYKEIVVWALTNQESDESQTDKMHEHLGTITKFLSWDS